MVHGVAVVELSELRPLHEQVQIVLPREADPTVDLQAPTT